MTITIPAQIFSFTTAGAVPPDRVDAQFLEHRNGFVLLDTFLGVAHRSDGGLKNGIVDAAALAPGVATGLTATVTAAVQPLRDAAQLAAAQAAADRATVQTLRNDTVAAASSAAASAAAVTAGAGTALATATQAISDADDLVTRLETVVSNVGNSENDAAFAAATAEEWAQVSVAWAEYMPGPIPPNILAIMGVTGDHWSSKWWSNKANETLAGIDQALVDAIAAKDAAEAAADNASDDAERAENAAESAEASFDEFQTHYLGAFAAPPTTDNEGNPLTIGATYFDTTIDVMRVWNGTIWQALTGVIATTAADVSYAPSTGVPETNVQDAIAGLGTSKAGEAPSDGKVYARKDAAWIESYDKTALDAEFSAIDTALAGKADGAATTAALNGKVAKAGDTMTGNLTVQGSVTSNIYYAKARTAPSGGVVVLEKPTSGTTLGADIGADISGNYFRVYENGGTTRGFRVDLTGCAAGATSNLWHSTNFKMDITTTPPASGDSLVWNGTNFSPVALVRRGGDTMTGDLVIGKANPNIDLDPTAAGQTGALRFKTNGLMRWAIFKQNTAESGSNAGSELFISAYDDAGVFKNSPFTISRASGLVTMANGALFPTGLTIRGAAATSRTPLAYLNSLGQARWWLAVTDDATGSDLTLSRYTSTGVYANDPLVIKNSNGLATFASTVQSSGTFQSTSQFPILAPLNSGGQVFLRPNGPGSTIGEFSVDAGGGVIMIGTPRPVTDNAVPLGLSSNRWSVVYAGTGTINTSDAREKRDLEVIDAATALALLDAIEPYWFRYNEGVIDSVDVDSPTETEEVQETQEVEVATTEYVREGDGMVLKRVMRIEHHPVTDELPVLDEDGAPVTRIGDEGEAVPLLYAAPRMITRPKKVRERVIIAPGSRLHAGFIAQHVHDALISVGRDPANHAVWTLADRNDPDSRQGLRETHLLAILWAATRALRSNMQGLEDRIAVLEAA